MKIATKPCSRAVGGSRREGGISVQDKCCLSGLESKGFSSDDSLCSIPIWTLVKIQEMEEMRKWEGGEAILGGLAHKYNLQEFVELGKCAA